MSARDSTGEGRLVEVRVKRWRRKHKKTLHELSDAIWNSRRERYDVRWHSWAQRYVEETMEYMEELARRVVEESARCHKAFGAAEAASTAERCIRQLACLRKRGADEIARKFTDEAVEGRYLASEERDPWLDRLDRAEEEVLEEAKDAIEEERLRRLVQTAGAGEARANAVPAQGREARQEARRPGATVAVHVYGGCSGAAPGRAGPEADAWEGAEYRTPTNGEAERMRTRVETLERRFVSRLDLSQFGALAVRQVVALAGQEYNERTRRYWRRNCAGCALPGNRKPGARIHYDPWRVARVLEDERIAPRWGAVAVQHCAETVAQARKLSAGQKESLDALLKEWLEGYSVPDEFTGVRDDSDREDIKAQVGLFVAQSASQGEGGLTRDEFDRAVERAEAQALAWWRQDVLRSRNRENRAPARAGDGTDFTGELDGFTHGEADRPLDATVDE